MSPVRSEREREKESDAQRVTRTVKAHLHHDCVACLLNLWRASISPVACNGAKGFPSYTLNSTQVQFVCWVEREDAHRRRHSHHTITASPHHFGPGDGHCTRSTGWEWHTRREIEWVEWHEKKNTHTLRHKRKVWFEQATVTQVWRGKREKSQKDHRNSLFQMDLKWFTSICTCPLFEWTRCSPSHATAVAITASEVHPYTHSYSRIIRPSGLNWKVDRRKLERERERVKKVSSLTETFKASVIGPVNQIESNLHC